MRNQPNNAARAMRPVKPWVIVLMVFVALACGFAQSSPRAVKGIVVDREGAPLRGSIVQIEDLASLEIRSFVTQEHGVYYFMDLSPDRDYKLQARYRRVWGPVKTLSRFNSRLEATIDLKVDVRKVE